MDGTISIVCLLTGDRDIAMGVISRNVASTLQPMRELHESGRTRGMSWRRKQLSAMMKMVSRHRTVFLDAMHTDLADRPVQDLMAELQAIKFELKLMLSSVKRAYQREKDERAGKVSAQSQASLLSWRHLHPRHSRIHHEPLRSPACLVIAPFFKPLQLTLVPAIGSLAGGNPTVLKPNELCNATATLLSMLVPIYFSKSACSVVLGGIPETIDLLSHEWGMIFFTGSQNVGKVITSMAAKTLTPVLLDIGEKLPHYFDQQYRQPQRRRSMDSGHSRGAKPRPSRSLTPTVAERVANIGNVDFHHRADLKPPEMRGQVSSGSRVFYLLIFQDYAGLVQKRTYRIAYM